MLGYRVPNPDEAMLISGGRGGKDGQPFKVVVGRGVFVLPLFRHVGFITLTMQEQIIVEQCSTQQGIQIEVKAVIAFKVGNDVESIVNAAQRFLSDQSQMPTLTGQVFAGHLRSIIGSMTVEQIIKERQTLASTVLDASKEEMGKLGLIVDSFQIQSVGGDQGNKYIAAMAAPHTAAIQRDAAIAEAQAQQEASKAQQEAVRQQADYERETEVTKAQYAAEVNTAQAASNQKTQVAQAEAEAQINQAKAAASEQGQVANAEANAAIGKAQAEANQAGPLAEAKAQQSVATEQTTLATKQAELREQQLLAEIVKPAEAQAQQVEVLARADAERTKVLAEAAASSNRVSLDQLLIEKLPDLAEKLAAGLQGSNLTILNGTEGLSQIFTGLVTQVKAIYETAQSIHASTGANGVATPEAAAEVRERIAQG